MHEAVLFSEAMAHMLSQSITNSIGSGGWRIPWSVNALDAGPLWSVRSGEPCLVP